MYGPFLIKETFGISYTLLFVKENCVSIPVVLFSSPGRVLPHMGYIGTCREISDFHRDLCLSVHISRCLGPLNRVSFFGFGP